MAQDDSWKGSVGKPRTPKETTLCVSLRTSRFVQLFTRESSMTRPKNSRRTTRIVLIGSGKTTLNNYILRSLAEKNLNVAVTGLDDVYLSFQQQEKLRLDNPGNTLWEGRGVAGTHDVELAGKMFDDLEAAQAKFVDQHGDATGISPVALPRYDKNAFGGRGDRLPVSTWPTIKPPIDVVVFEGWLNGMRALPDETVASFYNSDKAHYVKQHKLEHVLKMNSVLRRYEKEWWSRMDCCVHLMAKDYRYSYLWRWQAEQAANGPLTQEQIGKFVDRFMPMNELYMEQLSEHGMFKEQAGMEGRHLKITIDQDRKMVEHKIL